MTAPAFAVASPGRQIYAPPIYEGDVGLSTHPASYDLGRTSLLTAGLGILCSMGVAFLSACGDATTPDGERGSSPVATQVVTPLASPAPDGERGSSPVATQVVTPPASPTPLADPGTTPGQIAFACTWAICVANADGSGVVRLMDIESGLALGPSWSPDGRRIAFTLLEDLSEGPPSIYVMNADGSDMTRLTDGSTNDGIPFWSPDGRRIAFLSSQRDETTPGIYVMNADGSDVTRLADYDDEALGIPGVFHLSLAWSPDGRQMAFNSFGTGGEYALAIYVMNADGSSVRQLTDHTNYDGSPDWSPDGRRIAFTSLLDDGTSAESGIYVMNADGSNVTQLADDSEFTGLSLSLSWSPDGQRIAFISLGEEDTSAIYVMNADGSDVTHLADSTGWVTPFSLPSISWSPDGQEIAFTSPGDEGASAISIANADGSGVRELTGNSEFAQFDSSPVWSPAAVTALSSADDHGDSISDATPILDGSTVDGNIHISSDVDYFSFQAERGVRYTMATKLVSSYHTAMTLHDSDGSVIEEDTRSDGFGSASRIQWIAPDSSTYYVAVRVGVGYSGTYQLSLTSPQSASPPGPPRAGIAFSSYRGGNSEVDSDIYVMNPDGSNVTRLTNSLRAFDPEWSPDGRQIAFSSKDYWSGNYSIYVMNADGSGVTQLTYDPESDGNPSWSPDGRRIVFDSERDGNYNIYVMNADGSNVTRLTYNGMFNRTPLWSPDGRQIAFRSRALYGASQIYVMNSDGSDVTQLTNHDWSVLNHDWSPDGRRIVFNDANASGTPIRRIYVMNADGSGMTQLTSSDGYNSSPGWSPDGRQIVFTSMRDGGDRELYVMNADGSDVTRLTYHPAHDLDPSWSPVSETATVNPAADDHGNSPSNATPIDADSAIDGNIETAADVDFFSFHAEGHERYMMEIGFLSNIDIGIVLYDKNGSRIDRDHGLMLRYDSSGSPITGRDDDGRDYASVIEWNAPKSATYYIAVYGADAGTYEISLEPWHPATADLVAPLQGRIAFISDYGIYERIYVMNADGSGITRLTEEQSFNRFPSWSPDGRRIAFQRKQSIYVMNADGSGVTRLTDDSRLDLKPSWSPDGRKIAFASSLPSADGDWKYDIYVMNADGSGVTRLTDDAGSDSSPSWSPDGQRIAFNSDRGPQGGLYVKFEVYVIDADGSDVTQLTNQPGDRHGVYGRPSWSPDGQRIAFSSADENGSYDIYVVNADGSDLQRITDDPERDYSPSWSPDGQLIAFVSRRGRHVNREIYVMNADGSGVTRITYRGVDDYSPAWSPVGGVGSTP